MIEKQQFSYICQRCYNESILPVKEENRKLLFYASGLATQNYIWVANHRIVCSSAARDRAASRPCWRR